MVTAVMKITSIKQQAKRADRYSIFVEDKYAFSLSESALLESRLASGQELTAAQIASYKKLSADDKLYNQALRYVAMRPRSIWEVQFYLERKDAATPIIEKILDKLCAVGLLDDEKFAETYVRDRRQLRAASRRKLSAELQKKRLPGPIIEAALANDSEAETTALEQAIVRKRRQTKYADDTKLMEYLARQGFSYQDIKNALQKETDA